MRKPMKTAISALGSLLLVAAGFLIRVGGAPAETFHPPRPAPVDLSAFADTPPTRSMNVLFIHHSVGGQLLADAGPDVDDGHEIYQTAANGGGLRRLLAAQGYRVHEASYGSPIGDKTDLFDWLPKLRDQMDLVLHVDRQDRPLAGAETNEIVLFKSCFPNSDFVGEGEGPGNPAGPELTMANARATMTALLGVLASHPKVLFVYLTAPPIAAHDGAEPAWTWLAKRLLGRPTRSDRVVRSGELARQFNDWLKAPGGWLKDYPAKNVVVFDFYDVLTDEGASNLSRYPSRGGSDSHPSRAGNAKAAAALVPFLNRAVRRAEL
jgi:hypothetical protein